MIRSHSRRTVTALLGATPLLFLRGGSASGQISEMPPKPRSEAEQIALDAYIYGYSLITTEVTRVQMSNVDKVEGMHAPTGQFANIKRYPPADYPRRIGAQCRYALFAGVARPGRAAGVQPSGHGQALLPVRDDRSLDDGFRVARHPHRWRKAANYLITGPGWAGAVPAGMKQIKCATRYMVILGRTYADGTDQDYEAVNALQAQYKIVPLSAYGKPYTYQAPPVNPNPGFSMTDEPQSVILDMDTSDLFQHDGEADGRRCPSGGGRRADAGPHGQDRSRSRAAVRHGKARSGRAGRAQGSRQDRPASASRPTRTAWARW